MTEEVVVGVLLGAAVVVVVVSVVGLLAMGDVYQRLHFVAPISLVAPVLVAVALTVKEGWDENTGATWLALGFVVLSAPFLSHATVRAARIRERGDWRPGRDGDSRDGHRRDGRSRDGGMHDGRRRGARMGP